MFRSRSMRPRTRSRRRSGPRASRPPFLVGARQRAQELFTAKDAKASQRTQWYRSGCASFPPLPFAALGGSLAPFPFSDFSFPPATDIRAALEPAAKEALSP